MIRILVCYEVGMDNGSSFASGHSYFSVNDLTQDEMTRVSTEVLEMVKNDPLIASRVTGKCVFRSVVQLNG